MLNFTKNRLSICMFSFIIHFSAAQTVANDFESEIDRLFALPENGSVVFKNKGIDIGIAALTLAKEIYPDTTVRLKQHSL